MQNVRIRALPKQHSPTLSPFPLPLPLPQPSPTWRCHIHFRNHLCCVCAAPLSIRAKRFCGTASVGYSALHSFYCGTAYICERCGKALYTVVLKLGSCLHSCAIDKLEADPHADGVTLSRCALFRSCENPHLVLVLVLATQLPEKQAVFDTGKTWSSSCTRCCKPLVLSLLWHGPPSTNLPKLDFDLWIRNELHLESTCLVQLERTVMLGGERERGKIQPNTSCCSPHAASQINKRLPSFRSHSRRRLRLGSRKVCTERAGKIRIHFGLCLAWQQRFQIVETRGRHRAIRSCRSLPSTPSPTARKITRTGTCNTSNPSAAETAMYNKAPKGPRDGHSHPAFELLLSSLVMCSDRRPTL